MHVPMKTTQNWNKDFQKQLSEIPQNLIVKSHCKSNFNDIVATEIFSGN